MILTIKSKAVGDVYAMILLQARLWEELVRF